MWVVKIGLGLFGSPGATCDRMSFTSCDSENTVSLAENEPPELSADAFTKHRGERCSAPDIELSVGTVHIASFAFQPLVMTNGQMTIHQPPDS